MNLTLHYRTPCVVCGARLRGIATYGAPINKRSIRTTGTGLLYTDRRCYECGHPHDGNRTDPTLWVLTEKSDAEVAAYRARKWD